MPRNRPEEEIVKMSMLFSRRGALQIVAASFAIRVESLRAFGVDGEFWNTEEPAKWTSEEIQELTTKSPWAKPVTAELKAYAPLSSAIGGRRRSIGGVPRAGAGDTSGSPKFQGVVRWASAKPIRLALKEQFPDDLEGHFVISVSGLPIVSGHGGDDSSGEDSYAGLKQQTSLQVKGQAAVQPGIIEPDKKETSTLYFGFLPQLVQLDGDKIVTFETTMDPLKVKAKFEMKTMKFKGDLAV
jgi:hypothetical protein